jgi:Tfp pilus assembly protein PilF
MKPTLARCAVFLLSCVVACRGLRAADQGEQDGSQSKPTLPPKAAAKACLATANELRRHGYRREAISLYERARQLDPKQTDVCRVLAVLYDLEHMDRKALSEFRSALELSPKDADLLNDLGYFYLARHDCANAEKRFREALKNDPDNERAWTNLGLALAGQGRFQQSYEAFAKVSGAAAAHSNVGMLLAKSGMQQEAIRAFQNALELDPELKQARIALSVVQKQTASRASDPTLTPTARQ